jgi:soluble lytic murein transglycosylase-like protein/outer membrane protein assembly factor BamD (BamD/ComL family)
MHSEMLTLPLILSLLLPTPVTLSAVGTAATSLAFQSATDAALASTRASDRTTRGPDGKLVRLDPAEHLRRANVYMTNRAFAEAREHWQAFIDYYPQDPRVAEALLGMGRSYFQSRRYSEAYAVFERLSRSYGFTKEGREGVNFSGAALLRLGRPLEAAVKYVEYVDRFPSGERIETAHLNVIDAFREAESPQKAIDWITRTRDTFPGTPTATNALFARLRLDIAEGNWKHAITTADELRVGGFLRGVLTSPAEVAYLRAYSLERSGRVDEALMAYSAIPDGADSYFGGLATERVLQLSKGRKQNVGIQRIDIVNSQIAATQDQYPAPYRQAILKAAKARGLDARFVLALMKQESVFKPAAKSGSGARGLLQLTIDAAQKYAHGAGLKTISESDLYRPETSIAVGSEYLAKLSDLFSSMPEAMAASYNGGEDNVARWIKRAKQRDAGVFVAEIGFEETKGYVQKVMNNYRAYRELYTADLLKK